MIIKRFYDEKLAQASWLVGSTTTGAALVVDPNRDVTQYLDAAEAEGLRLTHVTETHIHADFVSGLRELATRCGARAHLSDEGGEGWSYAFAADLDAVLLRDGDEFRVGDILVRALHTPGHTPEHLSFLVTDTAVADLPMGAFTGDFIFVGDVGRPDLLEKAAGMSGTMDGAARQLYASLQRFKEQPDWLQLWPGHGAGSACGKALGAVPQTTLGYERIFNWGLATQSEAAFVAGVLAGQPEPPMYFAVMKRLNRDGPPLLETWPRPPLLPAAELPERLRAGATVVDVRAWPEFARAHAPGTWNIPLNRSFTTWVGSLVAYDADLYLVASEAVLPGAVRDLAMIGFDNVRGWIAAEELAAPAARLEETSVQDAHAKLDAPDVAFLDVRGVSEWSEAHLPLDHDASVYHIPLGELLAQVAALPRDRQLLVHCKGGGRSAIAASLLAAQGYADVKVVAGGLDAWRTAGYPVESESGLAVAVS